MALAGGLKSDTSEREGYLDSVFVYETGSSEWVEAAATLSQPMQAQAGLLIGDNLLCLGGLVDQVRSWYVGIGLITNTPAQFILAHLLLALPDHH